MTDVLVVVVIVLSIAVITLLLILLKRSAAMGEGQTGKMLREEFRLNREEAAGSAAELRKEVAAGQRLSTEAMVSTIGEMGTAQADRLEEVARRIKELTGSSEAKLELLRGTIEDKLKNIQESNERRLDQMRNVVDEKLQSTLEKRIGESFKRVSEQLERVHEGLGKMQSLADGVGDLKRVLTNVKTRGTWGEVQLGAILEQIMTPEQYGMNVKTKEDSDEHVEYVIKLPGRDGHGDSCVWLPIDSKFPQEPYLRLVQAAETADADAVKQAANELERAVKNSAKDISEKYLNPPRTTDFAIMFLPTEGLYAEVLRQPGLVEDLQVKLRVVVAGPTTLAAILNSLRMGFRTLAIEKRSSEVWMILGAIKTEFGRFGTVLDRVKRQLNTASNTIEETGRRTRAMERKLRDVEQLPEESTADLLGLPSPDGSEDSSDDA